MRVWRMTFYPMEFSIRKGNKGLQIALGRYGILISWLKSPTPEVESE